ncbi:MAG: hypothetical protein M1818_002343 [Claussenomyces sp. TS43310]|nr:MAG: hypothetical protein M1818_002343 [Claussenomyces sp. TS43310]
MASPTKIKLSLDDTGVFKFKPQDKETASKTSELLQKNHDNHHIFFNQSGFHNHIAHHLLTLYGLGAPIDVIEKQYKDNESYQRPAVAVHQKDVEDMLQHHNLQRYLGQEERYHDFLIFYQTEMERKGMDRVLEEYLFSGDEKADDLLARMFAGFLHPIIHLGFGLEFNQPAIVAEALAQASVHSNDGIKSFLLSAEKAAKSKARSKKTLPKLLDEMREDETIRNASRWEDGNKLRDGLLARAFDETVRHTSQWVVTPETLTSKTAEMINTAKRRGIQTHSADPPPPSSVYFTATAQHPPKQVKFDFFYIHCVNSSIFWSTFRELPFLSSAQKARLLEWKGRMDLALYASRGCPALLLEEVTGYVPKLLEAGDAELGGLVRRCFELDDDSHAVKLLRAVAHAEEVSGTYDDETWCKIRTFMWLKIGNMVLDSVEDSGETWVRSCGFDEAWQNFEDRPRQTHI